MNLKLSFGLILSAACASAIAHSELPTDTWCANGRPVPVADFAIYPETLIDARRGEQGQCTAGKGLAKECGQFDDDYGTSRRLAMHVCSAYAARQAGPGDVGSTIYVARQPASFLDAEHHRIYRVEQGLSGICVRCESRTPAPVPER